MPGLALEELVHHCAAGGDPTAWDGFVRLFQPVISSTIIKAVRGSPSFTPERIDDLIQEAYLRIWSTGTLNKFRSTEPKSIFGLIQAVAYSVALDEMRREGAVKRGGKIRFLPLDAAVDQSEPNIPDVDSNLLFSEIEEILTEIAPFPRDRLIFMLHYREGLSSKDIAALPSITLGQKGVESLLSRILLELRRRVLLSRLKTNPAATREGDSSLSKTTTT